MIVKKIRQTKDFGKIAVEMNVAAAKVGVHAALENIKIPGLEIKEERARMGSLCSGPG